MILFWLKPADFQPKIKVEELNMIDNFKIKSDIHFNMKSIEVLEKISGTEAFIVSDPIMEKLGYLGQVIDHLKKAGIKSTVFTDISPDPDIKVVSKGMGLYNQGQADVLVAIGGGSAIDTAKGILYFSWYMDDNSQSNREKPKFIAIPSTSGTGSEVTNFTVITAQGQKTCLVDDLMAPDIAILDSTCIQHVPQHVIADTGIDALVHAIEAYVSTKATDFTDALAEKAVKLIFDNLEKVYLDSSDAYARDRVHNAACIAGMAFTNTSLGINHSLAHALGGTFNIPHGRSNALLLVPVIKYNAELRGSADGYGAKKYCQLAELLGLPARTTREGVVSLISSIEELYNKLGIDSRASALGIDELEFEESLEDMAEVAMNDRCTPTNPIQPTREDLVEILRNCY